MNAMAELRLLCLVVAVVGGASSAFSETLIHTTSPVPQTADSEIRQNPGREANANEETRSVTYPNTLVRVMEVRPILGRAPEFAAPITVRQRFQGSPVVVDETPTLAVRAWRYSYNARSIVEIPNALDGHHTAVIVVHPWGVDERHGIRTPDPAGVAFFSTPDKNAIYHRHIRKILNPFLDRMRSRVALVGYSLPGREDALRRELYRSPRTDTLRVDRRSGMQRLQEVLSGFRYTGQPLRDSFPIAKGKEVRTYFEAFRGLDESDRYNNVGFWDLPVPLASSLKAAEEDVVFYDEHGYEELRRYLQQRNITNVLLAGYSTDVCVRSSTAGYENLRRDFNVFIVGDATLATFPAQDLPSMATTVALARASLDNLITETAWIRVVARVD